MGSAAGSGSESRDKLAGAVTAPQGVFPQAQQGGHILNPSQKQVDKWNHPNLDFPAQAHGIFWLTFFSCTETRLCRAHSWRDQRLPAHLPSLKSHPASQESLLFGCWGSKQLCSLCIYFTQTLTGRLNLTKHTYAVEKGNKVLDSPHATLVLVHSHLLWSTEIICFTPQLSPRPVKDLEHQNKKKNLGLPGANVSGITKPSR